jgi:hypothetical protein
MYRYISIGGRGEGSRIIFHLFLKAVLGMFLQYVRDNWLHHQLAKKSTILARYLPSICMAGKGFTFISQQIAWGGGGEVT